MERGYPWTGVPLWPLLFVFTNPLLAYSGYESTNSTEGLLRCRRLGAVPKANLPNQRRIGHLTQHHPGLFFQKIALKCLTSADDQARPDGKRPDVKRLRWRDGVK